jgi:hypothetical protein
VQKLLQYIPGFRNGARWKKIVASLYYIFTLLMLGAGIGTFLVFLSAPFLVFSIIDLIHKKKSAAIVLLVSLALMITGIAIIPSPPDNQLAAEQQQSKDEAEQQSQQNEQDSSKNVELAPVPAQQPPEKPATNLKVHFIDVGQGDCILI